MKKHPYLGLLLLACASFCLGQGAFVAPQTAFRVVNGYTSPLAGATITVCASATGGIPCSPALVDAIFQDLALSEPLSNPFTADASGNYQFAIAPGTYTVSVTAFGFAGYSYQITAGGSGGGGGISGSGSAPFFPIWTGPTAIGNSELENVSSPNGLNYSLGGGEFFQLDASGLNWDSGVTGSSNILIQNSYSPASGNNAGGIAFESAPATGSACAGGVYLLGNGTNGAGNGASIYADRACSNGFGAVGADAVVEAGSTSASNAGGDVILKTGTGGFSNGRVVIKGSVPPNGCLDIASGVIGSTGVACGSGGGGSVSSVTNSDGTLTISPTSGAVVAALALAHPNTWTGLITAGGGLNVPSAQTLNIQAGGNFAVLASGNFTFQSATGVLQAASGVVSANTALATGTTAFTEPPFTSNNTVATTEYADRAVGGNATVNPITYGAKFNVQVVPDATTTNGSNIVTCPNADCFFLTTAVVGQIIFGTQGTGSSCLDNPTSLAQTTIQSVDSDTQIHTAGNASLSGTAINCLAWGDDDTTAYTNAWNAGGCFASMVMPVGRSFFSSAIMQKIAGCPLASNAGLAFESQRIFGQGVGNTFLIPTMNFNFASCPAKPEGCLSNSNVSDEENFSVWGIGVRCAATHNLALMIEGISTRLVNVGNAGWCGRGGGSTLVGLYVNGGTNNFNISGPSFFGSVQIEFTANAHPVSFNNNYVSGNIFSVNSACLINVDAGAWVVSYSNDIAGCIEEDGWWTSILDKIENNLGGGASCFTLTAASVLSIEDSPQICLGQGPGEVAVYSVTSGAVVKVRNSKLSAGSATQVFELVAGDTVYDQGGNSFNTSSTLGTWNQGGTWIADGHSQRSACTGTATASSTLGLYGSGANVSATTCTSTTLGAGTVNTGSRSLTYLFINAGTGGVNSSSGVFTVLVNGSTTAATCTTGTATKCQWSGTVSLADGDLVSIQFTTQAAETLANVKATIGWQ